VPPSAYADPVSPLCSFLVYVAIIFLTHTMGLAIFRVAGAHFPPSNLLIINDTEPGGR